MSNNKVLFVAVGAFSSIPLVRFVVDLFEQTHHVEIVDTQIENANSYFQKRLKVKLLPLALFRNTEDYLKGLGKGKPRKYFKLVAHLFKCLKDSSFKVIYTTDIQVLFVIFLLRTFVNTSTKIIYHQFEVVDLKDGNRVWSFLYQFVRKRAKKLDLLIFPEINRMHIFCNGLDIKQNQKFLFPNTCVSQIHIKNNTLTLNEKHNIPDSHSVCLHVGAVGGDNHYYQNFIKAAKQLESIGAPITFLFIGRITAKQKKITDEISVNNIRLISAVSHESLMDYYQLADIGLILYRPTGLNYEFCAPNKLYEYWSHGIPVIAHILEGLKPLFNKKYQGCLVNFENKNELLSSLQLQASERINRELLVEYFEKEFSVQKYLNEFQELLKEMNIYDNE